MATTATQAPAQAAEHRVKPEKPDENAYKISLANAEKDLAAAQKKLEAIKAKIESATPNNQDSPVAKRQQELRSQLAAIRQQQQGFKASRTALQEKINALDTNIKARFAEQKNQRDRLAFKSVEDIDREIQRLEKEVDSGTMRLVDEKKNLTEISNLRKQRKNFSSMDDGKKNIDEMKAQLSALKKGLDNPEAKALSEQYTALQKELDDIKSEQDSVFKNIKSLREERTKIHNEQQKAWNNVKEIKDNYHKARRSHREYEQEAYRIRQERQKAEREIYERERKKKIADKKLEEASLPAFTDELLTAEGLIRHFDPTFDLASIGLGKTQLPSSVAYRAQVGRTVDNTDIKGVKVIKKDDRDDNYFMGGTGGKKGKKGKKGLASNNSAAAQPEATKFNLSFGVLEDLARVKVDPPMNQSDVPALIEKLVEKVKDWKSNQASKTAENIKKAQEEIDRLEEESKAAEAKTSGTSTPKVAAETNTEAKATDTAETATAE
ncbi:multicopy suppressor of BFA (Brefeldin A) [Microsporum canis]|uniref:Nuclear segregation protein Bfr1 n=1 Tax=Arthroderma otae (strain ATCC MYA-4605 / CBS 113480) TaxID=554155 RepID=C5FC75_ARTOC|nr:nuclear segregation protein Bfr1 [Microsporum canis CBS 113480]EEQ27498.1 nuclear segregation protein Bfr1 [Microsporum canis CBS 113480]